MIHHKECNNYEKPCCEWLEDDCNCQCTCDILDAVYKRARYEASNDVVSAINDYADRLEATFGEITDLRLHIQMKAMGV